MGIYKVYYCPLLSQKAKNIIADEVSASAIASDDSTSIYDIDQCIESLQNKNGVEADINMLKSLDVEYIEFKNHEKL